MKIKKLLSVLTIAATLLFSAVACDTTEPEVEKTPAELEAAALSHLETVPYRAVLSADYSSDDPDMNEIYKEMSTSATISVSDKSYSMISDTAGISSTVIYHDSVVYMDMLDMKVKAPVTSSDLDTVTDEMLSQIDLEVGVNDFITVEKIKNDDGTQTVKCSGLNESALSKLSLGEGSDLFGIEINTESLKYEFTVDAEGRFKSLSLFVDMSMDGEELGIGTFSVSATSSIDYSYDNVTVGAPADADSYELVDFDDIFGSIEE